MPLQFPVPPGTIGQIVNWECFVLCDKRDRAKEGKLCAYAGLYLLLKQIGLSKSEIIIILSYYYMKLLTGYD